MAIARLKESDPVIQARIDKTVQQFILIRDKIKEIEDRQEQELAPYKQMKEKLAGTMVEFLDSTGQTSAKTKHGTVSILNRSIASLADPDAFMAYVAEHRAFDLMDRRANSTACREFAEEHGSLPPGVKLNNTRTAGVRKAS